MDKTAKDAAWADAKKRCRITDEDIRMAKQLGMTPKSLMKNIPAKSQQWKAPVREWIRELHEEKFGKSQPAKAKATPRSSKLSIKQEKDIQHKPSGTDQDLPF